MAVWIGLSVAGGCGGGPLPDESHDALPDEWRDPTTGMSFVLVRPSEFEMGLRHPPGDVRPAPPHRVVIERPFYIGRHEVTQRQWADVMGENPSHFTECGLECPVESVSWLQVQAFLDRLNARGEGERFRLPTEAEWELVCRSGGDGRYTDGLADLTVTQANYNPEVEFEGVTTPGFRGSPTPVGTFPANGWGVYDIHGNVWEWTQDEYCPYPEGMVADPRGSCGTDTIPIRGGSWLFSANAARCGRRYTHARTDSGYSLGFRVVRLVERPDASGVELSRFEEGVAVTGRVVRNLQACTVDGDCHLELEFSDTTVIATYGTGERPRPVCEAPRAVADRAFDVLPGDLLWVVVQGCPGEGLVLAELAEPGVDAPIS